ncbi:MAG: hypothetical protein HY998_08785 [candidate division NC10 bacterium]|nr:hypothetical protein [candidate division NC10 bacterium]
MGEGQELGPVGKYAVVKMPTKDARTQEIRFINDETNQVYTQQVSGDLKFMVVSGVVAVDATGKLVILEPGKSVSIIDPSTMPQETKGIIGPSTMPQN